MAGEALKAKQRFLSLDVDEVSLVDNPANCQKFVTKKSISPEDTVSQPNRASQMTEALSEATIIKSVAAVLKDMKDGKPNSADGDKQYDSATMMKKLQDLCAEKAMPPGLKAKLQKLIEKGAKKQDKVDEKAEKPIDTTKQTPHAANEDPAQPGGAKAGAAKAKKDADVEEEEVTASAKKDAPVAKAVGDGVGDPQVELIHSLLMAAMGTIQKVSTLVDMEISDMDSAPVEKGLKQFSAERVGQLKNAAKQMVDLLKELDPAHLSDLGMGVGDSATAKAPKDGGADGASGADAKTPPVVSNTTTPAKNPPVLPDGPAQGQSSPASEGGVAASIKKAVEEALAPLTAKLEEVQKQNKDLQDKVTTMESVRGVSKSLNEEGEGTDKPVAKGKSLFAGVV